MPTPVVEEVISDYDDALEASRTYHLDFENKRIIGFVDQREAIKQYICKTLITERASFSIYGTDEGINYGTELERFIGKSISFIRSDIERTVTDALTQDERILGVSDFTIGEPEGDTVAISFTVSTLFGDVEISEGVRIK